MPLINQKRFDEAVRLHEAGHLDQAAALYRPLLAKTPKHPDLLHLYGVLQAQQGDTAKAIEMIGEAVRLKPGNAEYLENLAAAHHSAGDGEAATRIMAAAGNCHLAQKQYAEAIRVYAEALEVQPHNPHLLSNTGVALARQQKPEEAMPWFERALEADPDFVDAILNRGNILWSQGAYGEALASYRRCEALAPLAAMPQLNLGFALNALGQVDEALVHYERAIALHPGFAKAHHDRGMALLSKGQLKEGFAELEWRWAADYEYAEPRRPYRQPLWRGGPLKGRLLVFQEQGYGDTILLSRFLPDLAARGYDVLVETRAPLHRLFESAFMGVPGLSIIPELPRFEQGKLPPKLLQFAAYVGILSLPQRLGITGLAADPYLKPDSDLVAHWAARLPTSRNGCRVGIVWAGEPRANDPTGSVLDRQRSLTFAQFMLFLDVNGITWVNLQKGKPAEQMAARPKTVAIYDPMPEAKDFADTAAIIENLDLVITVDTAVANLAGAMSKPVWVLVRLNTDWRWMDKGPGTLWYPSARVFRQKTLGDWQPVLEDIRAELQKKASEPYCPDA